MTTKKMSQLPSAGALSITDDLYIAQGDNTIRRVTMEEIVALLRSVGVGGLTAPPNADDFTAHSDSTNGTTALISAENVPGEMRLKVPGVSHLPTTQHYLLRPDAPSAFPFTMKARIMSGMPDIAHTHFGIAIFNTVTKHAIVFGYTGFIGQECNKWTQDETGGAPVFGGNLYRTTPAGGIPFFAGLSITADGNVTVSTSVDGEIWIPTYVDNTAFLGTTLANLRVGFVINDEDARASSGTTYTDSYGHVFYYEDTDYEPQNQVFNPDSMSYGHMHEWDYQPPGAADFVELGGLAGGSLADDADLGLLFACPPPAAGDNPFGMIKPIPSPASDWTAEMGFHITGGAGNFAGVGFALKNSGIAKVIVCRMEISGSGSPPLVGPIIGSFNLPSGFGGNVSSSQFCFGSNGKMFLRVRHIALTSQLEYSISANGKQWIVVFTESDTAQLGGVPDRIGPGGFFNRAAGPMFADVFYWRDTFGA